MHTSPVRTAQNRPRQYLRRLAAATTVVALVAVSGSLVQAAEPLPAGNDHYRFAYEPVGGGMLPLDLSRGSSYEFRRNYLEGLDLDHHGETAPSNRNRYDDLLRGPAPTDNRLGAPTRYDDWRSPTRYDDPLPRRDLNDDYWRADDRRSPNRYDDLLGGGNRYDDLLRSRPDDFRYDRNPILPVPVPEIGRPEDRMTESEKIHQRLTARYRNPVVNRFVQRTSAQQGLQLYAEATRLIDSRHIQPVAYDVRVRQAVNNLSHAVENPAFLEMNRLSLNTQQVRAFQNALSQLVSTQPVRTAADAQNMLSWTINLAGQQAGLRPGVVVMEFVSGAAESLDKYSAFNPEDPAGAPSASALDSQIVGIGVEIKPHDEGVQIVKAIRGGPAQTIGLQSGDVIVSVNGRSVKGQSLDQIVDQIAGQVGTQIVLGVVRDGRSSATVTLVRQRINIPSVGDVQMVDAQNKVGYIKLDKFAESSDQEVDQALWTLHQQGMKSLVFDLRGNPGGLLTTAISLSDKFLPSGVIVSTKGRTTADQSIEQARYEQTWNIPLVVLIDANSASASEIFAAAIQENKRGVIVGRTSYGKGTVQTHFPLQSTSGNLKLTTANFYGPSGRVMAEVGVTPDIPVELWYRDSDLPQFATASDRDVAAAVRIASNPLLEQLSIALARR